MYWSPDAVVTSLPSGPACSNGMVSPCVAGVNHLLRFMSVIGTREHGDTCRVTMKEISSSHRTDLPLCKKAGHWNRSHPLLHDTAVMMGAAEEPFPSPATTEEERTQGWIRVLRTVGREQDMQIVAR